MDIESESSCSWDYLEIYNGDELVKYDLFLYVVEKKSSFPFFNSFGITFHVRHLSTNVSLSI